MPCAILICLRALRKSDAHVESQHALCIWHVGYLQFSRRFQVINFIIILGILILGMPKSIILVSYNLNFFPVFDSVFHFDNLKFIPVYRVCPSRTFMHLFAIFSYVFFTGFCLCFFIHILNIFVYTQICANIYKRKKGATSVCVKEKERDSEKERAVQKANSIRTTVSCWKRKVAEGKKNKSHSQGS